MSLIGALNIGRSALTVNQAALQVTGNNIANAGNANYTRQVANTSPSADQQIGQGMSIGTGIDLTSIERQIDEALQGRLRSSVSDDNSASTTKQWLDRVESVFNELGDQDLSTQLSKFFSGWSTLAANAADPTQRMQVVSGGQELATQIKDIRSSLGDIQSDLGSSAKALASTADGYAKQIADLNKQVAAAGGASGSANALRDQRDGVLEQLSELVNVQTADGGGGMVNVFIGSQPLVTGATSRGLTTTATNVNGQSVIGVSFKTGGGGADVTGGQLGAMMQLQGGQLQTTISQLDSLAGNLINEVNKVYAGGQGLQGFTSVTGTSAVTDANAALDSAGLPFTPTNGSFVVGVYNSSGQAVSSGLISVKLGADAAGSPTTLTSLAAALGGIANITATVTNGKLTLSTGSSDLQIRFGTADGNGSDTSGTLAALGLNTFFSGSKASDIAVNQAVAAQPSLLVAGYGGGTADNAIALKIAALQTAAIRGMNGATLTSAYSDMINQTAVASATAQNNADAATTVRSTLEAQRESLSGVSMDEESVNLIKQQRAFQGAAKLVSAIDDMMKTVLNMVG